MIPVQEFDRQIYWILEEIVKEDLLTPKGQNIEYVFRIDADSKTPSPLTQLKLLRKLAEWGALEIKGDSTNGLGDSLSSLKLNPKRFDEIYMEYSRKNDCRTEMPPLISVEDRILYDLYKIAKSKKDVNEIKTYEIFIASIGYEKIIEEYANCLQKLKETGLIIDYSFKKVVLEKYEKDGKLVDKMGIDADCKVHPDEFVKSVKFLWEPKRYLSNRVAKDCYNLIRVINAHFKNPGRRDEKLSKLYLELCKEILGFVYNRSQPFSPRLKFLFSRPFTTLFGAERQLKEWKMTLKERMEFFDDFYSDAIQVRDIFSIIEDNDKKLERKELENYLDSFADSDEKEKKYDDKIAPIPFMLVNDVSIKGLEKGLATIAKNQEEKKNKFPHKLPSGTEWKNFIIQFLNKEEVFIKVSRFKEKVSFIDMGFADGRFSRPQPNEGWGFMWVLAKYNGELTMSNPYAKDSYKKQKELATKALKHYFDMESDPFYPYSETKSYKTRFTLLQPEFDEKVVGHQMSHQIVEKETIDEEIKNFFEEQTPQIYKKYEGGEK